MSAKTDVEINPYEPTDQDYERVGGKLTEFSLGVAGPDWSELKFAFQAVVDGVAVADLIGDYNAPWGLAHVSLLHVEPECRGMGIGKQLMRKAEDFAKAHGCNVITVETPTWQGEGFYEGIGYREIGRTPLPKVIIDGVVQSHIKYDKNLV